MGIFSNAKDRMIERVALSYLNANLLAPYGRATNLTVDSTAQTLRITVELKGETTPVELEIVGYEISEDADRYFASIKALNASREWLTTLAREQFCNRRFELSAQVARLLMKVL
jgi:hypothetical protein